MKLIINNQESTITTAADLERACDVVRQQQFNEVWLGASDDGPSLARLVHGEAGSWRGWFMARLVHGEYALLIYLPDNEGSLGFTSRNPAYAGAPDTQIEFVLANGQLDEHPAAWTYPLSVGCAVCSDFVQMQGALSPLITWRDGNNLDDVW